MLLFYPDNFRNVSRRIVGQTIGAKQDYMLLSWGNGSIRLHNVETVVFVTELSVLSF
ncbi:hypothetical protein ACSAZL_19080 [Methanosarcina sp. T3]|uniref:hypothetical protein n=1 Tax=Methanosarcina sp. T3 TaxID=3439062 RepID=UPI003F8364A6